MFHGIMEDVLFSLFSCLFHYFHCQHGQSQYITWKFLCRTAGDQHAKSQAGTAPALKSLLVRNSCRLHLIRNVKYDKLY